MAGPKPAWSDSGRTGPVRAYLDQRIFACEGMLVVIDYRPGKDLGECVVLDCKTAEERAAELNVSYRDQKYSEQPKGLRDLWTERRKGCQNILECVKEARAMGDPANPQVQAFWKRHNTLRVAGYAKPGMRLSRKEVMDRVAPKMGPQVGTTFLGSQSASAATAQSKLYTPPQRIGD